MATAVVTPLGSAVAAIIVLGVLKTVPTMIRSFPLECGGFRSRTELLIDVYMFSLCDWFSRQLMLVVDGPVSDGCRASVCPSSVPLVVVSVMLWIAVIFVSWCGLCDDPRSDFEISCYLFYVVLVIMVSKSVMIG